MQLIWRGHSCFQLSTNPVKDKSLTLVFDPFDESLGLKVPLLAAEILLISHEHFDHNNRQAVSGSPLVLEGPGEYEVQGVYIQGIPAFHDKNLGKERGRITIYTVESEDLKVCHLGDLGQKELFPEQIEDLGEVDVLLIPVGGTFTLDAEEAVKIIGQVEPKIVVPMHYSLPGLKLKLDGVEKFLKTMGKKSIEPLPRLTVKKKDLVGEGTQIVVLKP